MTKVILRLGRLLALAIATASATVVFIDLWPVVQGLGRAQDIGAVESVCVIGVVIGVGAVGIFVYLGRKLRLSPK